MCVFVFCIPYWPRVTHRGIEGHDKRSCRSTYIRLVIRVRFRFAIHTDVHESNVNSDVTYSYISYTLPHANTTGESLCIRCTAARGRVCIQCILYAIQGALRGFYPVEVDENITCTRMACPMYDVLCGLSLLTFSRSAADLS